MKLSKGSDFVAWSRRTLLSTMRHKATSLTLFLILLAANMEFQILQQILRTRQNFVSIPAICTSQTSLFVHKLIRFRIFHLYASKKLVDYILMSSNGIILRIELMIHNDNLFIYKNSFVFSLECVKPSSSDECKPAFRFFNAL